MPADLAILGRPVTSTPRRSSDGSYTDTARRLNNTVAELLRLEPEVLAGHLHVP